MLYLFCKDTSKQFIFIIIRIGNQSQVKKSLSNEHLKLDSAHILKAAAASKRFEQHKLENSPKEKTYPADCRKIAAVDSNKHDWD